MNYVLGFALTPDGKIALIRKAKPEWQAGKLNGVGGKIEDFDSSVINAMTREFQEETGVFIEPHLWREVGVIRFNGGVVWVYTVTDPMIEGVVSPTIEEVTLVDLDWCLDNLHQLLPNVMTLVHASTMRLNEHGKLPYITLDYRS